MSKFDYYRATFLDLDHDEMIASLLRFFDLSSVRPSVGRHGYKRGAVVHRGDHKLATIWWDGTEPGVCVSVTSDDAVIAVPFLRSLGPHQVPRADVCWDLDGPGLYDQITH